MSLDCVLIITTCNQKEILSSMARPLIEKKWVACSEVSGPKTSLYHWEGRIETQEEWQLLLKTTPLFKSRVVSYLEVYHPYDCPEILYLQAEASAAYFKWMQSSLLSS